jgi:hypothetical protein
MTGLRHGMPQGVDAIPENLHTDANEEERGEAHDDAHAGGPQKSGQAISECVANEDAYGDEGRSDNGGEDPEKTPAEVAGLIGSESNGHRYGARADRERQGQRVEGVAKDVLGLHVLAGSVLAFFLVFALEQRK